MQSSSQIITSNKPTSSFYSPWWCVQGSYVQASSQLRSCLLALGRPLPTTKLDLFASLFWNTLRYALHWTGVGVALEVWAGHTWRSVTADDIRLSARDAAVVYSKLLQLHLTGEIQQLH